MHLTRPAGHADFEYKYFFLDVRGHPRIYLENADAKPSSSDSKKAFRLFGVNWK